jgi:triacylglycerol esterase/lipase EstA (alpha/beta hydrolase family)
MATKHLGDRPIVLVCHSLGGLVAKQLLRTSFDLTATAESQKIAKAVRGVIFLATPHSGAGSANFIADFAKGLGLIGSLFRVTDTLTVHS